MVGIAMFLFTGNVAFADVVAGPVGPDAGLVVILGMVCIALAVIAIVIILNIRKKNAKQ
jgi:uncharacterized protein involved in exopolysaccharide biosynthesis